MNILEQTLSSNLKFVYTFQYFEIQMIYNNNFGDWNDQHLLTTVLWNVSTFLWFNFIESSYFYRSVKTVCLTKYLLFLSLKMYFIFTPISPPHKIHRLYYQLSYSSPQIKSCISHKKGGAVAKESLGMHALTFTPCRSLT